MPMVTVALTNMNSVLYVMETQCVFCAIGIEPLSGFQGAERNATSLQQIDITQVNV